MDNMQINILAIGYNTSIMEVVDRLINSHNNWKGSVALSKEAAKSNLKGKAYDIALLCAGVSVQDETDIRTFITEIATNTTLVRHFGGGSGLLENELRSALDKKLYKTI